MAESVAEQAKYAKKKSSKRVSSDELSDHSDDDSDGSISSVSSSGVLVSQPLLTRKVHEITKMDKHVAPNEEVNMR